MKILSLLKRQQLRLQEATRPSPRVALFDVFDTLLMRRVSTVAAMVEILGRQLQVKGEIPWEPAEFATLRLRTEKSLQEKKATSTESQFTLEELALEFARLAEIEPEAARRCFQAELELEAEMLIAVPGARALVQSQRAQGRTVAYVSDMYLPAEKIMHWLRREGIAAPGERVFVSGEQGVGKGTGNLFLHVLDVLKTEARFVDHFGNSVYADVRGARKVAIRPQFQPGGNPTRYEAELARDNSASSLAGGIFAGASRQARLSCADLAPEGFVESVAGVVAPLLVAFVIDVLQDAKRRGLAQIAFLSRDGQILLRIAERIAPRLGIQIPMKYIYSSRRVWSLAGISDCNESTLAWVCESTEFLSVQSCLRRAGLSPEAFKKPLVELGFQESDHAKNLDEAERSRLFAWIHRDEQLHEAIRHEGERVRDFFWRYLEQEGLASSEALGLVDLGWHGTLQQALAQVFEAKAPSAQPQLVGYYIGLNRSDRFQSSESNQAFGFLRDEYRDRGMQAVHELKQLGFILETFCTADHGSLYGYRENEEQQIEPVLDVHYSRDSYEGRPRQLLQIVMSFVDALFVEEGVAELSLPPPESFQANLARFWRQPSRAEAEAWASFPLDDRRGADEERVMLLSPAFDWQTAVSVIQGGHAAVEVPWYAASLAQAPRGLPRALSASLAVRKKFDSVAAR